MSVLPVVSVWSPWRLHADSVVVVLDEHGIRAQVVDDPVAAAGLLVASAMAADQGQLLRERASAGRSTILWGGTLPPPRIAELRDAGALAYVSMLHAPSELVAVVSDVLSGEDVPWTDAVGPLPTLTEREQGVARAYLVDHADRTRAEVAQILGISDRTLKVHVANVRAKAGHRGTHTREGLRRALTVRGWLD